MIVYINTSGTAIAVQPSPVYQGSSLAGLLYLVAPFPTTNDVSVAFTLANGEATDVYPMTSVSALPDVLNALGDEYSVWQWQVEDARITAEAGTVTVQFAVSYNGQTVTTSSVNFTVQEGVLPLPPTTPSADEWQTLIELYGNLSGRVTALENRQTAKVLVDFTVNETTGEGVKYYSDGTTATVQFPTGTSGGGGAASDLVNVMTFTTDSWVSAGESGGYELAFGAQQTGFDNADFVALLDRSGTATYEAGTETTPSQRTGYFSLSDSIFKGSDGSILLTANATYAGRIVTIGGEIVTGQTVTDATYSTTTHALTLYFVNGTTATVQFESNVSQFTNDAGYQTAAQVAEAVETETTARENADEGLQAQITQNTQDIATLETGLESANSNIASLQEDVNNKEHFRGYYATTAQIQSITDPDNGDFAYNAQTGTKWAYDNGAWSDTEEAVPDQVTPKTTSVPLMDGTAAIGNQNAYAAGDHVHPTDTTRAAASALTAHVQDTNNPHEVTPGQIGAQPAGSYVTTNTEQNITAQKTFTNGVGLKSGNALVVLAPPTSAQTSGSYSVTVPEKSGTLAMLDDIPTVATGAYITSITTSNWTGSTAPYSYTITAATHGKGTSPVVTVYNSTGNQIYLGVSVNTSGTVTLSSNAKLACKIVIN